MPHFVDSEVQRSNLISIHRFLRSEIAYNIYCTWNLSELCKVGRIGVRRSTHSQPLPATLIPLNHAWPRDSTNPARARARPARARPAQDPDHSVRFHYSNLHWVPRSQNLIRLVSPLLLRNPASRPAKTTCFIYI